MIHILVNYCQLTLSIYCSISGCNDDHIQYINLLSMPDSKRQTGRVIHLPGILRVVVRERLGGVLTHPLHSGGINSYAILKQLVYCLGAFGLLACAVCLFAFVCICCLVFCYTFCFITFIFPFVSFMLVWPVVLSAPLTGIYCPLEIAVIGWET